MKKTLILAAALAPFLVPATAFAQALEPGEWQFEASMSSPMIPQAAQKKNVTTRCITDAESKNPEAWLGKQADADCKITPTSRSAERFAWTIDCPKAKMTGSGVARLGKGTIESDQKLTGDMQGQKFEMQVQMTGRRLGACKK